MSDKGLIAHIKCMLCGSVYRTKFPDVEVLNDGPTCIITTCPHCGGRTRTCITNVGQGQ